MPNTDKFSVKNLMSKVDSRSIIEKLSKSDALDNIMHECLMEVYSPSSASRVRSKVIPELRASVVENLVKCVERLERASEFEELLQKAGLDMNWMIATVCLAIQDVLVKRTARRLHISTTFITNQGKTDFRSTQWLMNEIEKQVTDKGIITIALGIARQWNMKFRNNVIHDGHPVTEKESRRILDATNDLLDELSVIIGTK